jgi:phage protein D
MTPFCKLEFDGAPSQLVTDHLISVNIVLNSGKDPDKIDVKLSDPFSQLPRPRDKAKIYCTLGYIGGKKRKHGPFIVDEYAGDFDEDIGEFLSIKGTSVDLQSKIKNRATKTHKKKTLGDIIKAEAGAEGFGAYVSPDIASFYYKHFHRGEKSLMQMIGELAETHDGIEKYKDGKVFFMSRALGMTASGGLLQHTLSRSELKSWNWVRTFRNNYKGVKASNRDHDEGKRKVSKEPLGDGDAWYEIRKLFPNEELAKTAVKSKAKQLKRDERNITIKTKIGDPDLLEQVDLTLTGISPEVNMAWVTKTATHEYDADANGYNSEATCEMKI